MDIFLLLFLILSSHQGGKQVDTLLPELAWPYYVFESTKIEGYKAMMFEPPMPCSVREFVCGVGSMTNSASKECELNIWSNAGGKPNLLLFSDTITINANDSGKVYFHWYKLSSPVEVVGPFWVGVKEQEMFPTIVFDEIPSRKSAQSQDGINWGTFDGDYFYGVVLDYSGEPDIYIEPDSLELFVTEGNIDTGRMWIYNIGTGCALKVDSITWSEDWILSVSPDAFELAPGYSEPIYVVIKGLGAGEYGDTLWIFSNDPDESVGSVPVILKSIEVLETDKRRGCRLECYPNPALQVARVRFQIPDAKYQTSNISLKIYDVGGRLVRVLFESEKECGSPQSGVHILPIKLAGGIYFVKLRVNSYEIIKKLIVIR